MTSGPQTRPGFDISRVGFVDVHAVGYDACRIESINFERLRSGRGATSSAGNMIRTLICDLGNVLFYFSHEKMYAQLGSLFGMTGSEMKEAFADNGWLREYETGRVSTPQLRELMLDAFAPTVGEIAAPDDEELLRASSDIFQQNDDMLDLVTRLKQTGLRLVLLSNTSDAHRIWIDRQSDILQSFDALVLSYEVGFVKPEVGIYESAQAEANCRPDECFYVDDIPEYVAMGRRHGWHAEVYRTTAGIVDRLRALGVEVPRHS